MLCTFLRVYLSVSYDPQNKQEMFPKTELHNWTLQWRRNLFSVMYKQLLYIIYMNFRCQKNNVSVVHCVKTITDLPLALQS
jgi:hypothetical protein